VITAFTVWIVILMSVICLRNLAKKDLGKVSLPMHGIGIILDFAMAGFIGYTYFYLILPNCP